MEQINLVTVSRNYFNMPLWVAKEAGHFATEGLDVTITLREPIDAVIAELKAGTAQIGCGVTEQVILDRESGGSLEIIGGNVNKLPFDLIGGKGITSFEQMRGKVVGVSSLEAGSSSLIMKLFDAHGMSCPEDYTIEAVGPILSRWERLQSGAIQAGLQGSPLNYIALDAGFTTLAKPRDQFPHFQFTTVNVDSGWAEQNANVVTRFMRALVRAHEWYFANREEATDIAVAMTGVDRSYALHAWDEYTGDEIFPRDADASDEAIQTLIEISGLIRGLESRRATHPGDYVNRKYLHEAQHSLASA
jgi:ABC-type nitrate/sulfonate/bicarbonate transport system substrate-binding protein